MRPPVLDEFMRLLRKHEPELAAKIAPMAFYEGRKYIEEIVGHEIKGSDLVELSINEAVEALKRKHGEL